MSNLNKCFLPGFGSFGQAFQRRRFFLEINQSETRIACGGHVCKRIKTKSAIFIEDLPQMLPTKFQFTWPTGYRDKIFRNRPTRNKNCLWQPFLLRNRGRNEQSLQRIFHRCLISYPVSVHRRKCLEIDQPETRIAYGGHVF